MSVSWLLQCPSDVPESDDWLSPAELQAVGRFFVPKRRRQWRLGRWTAKRALVLAGAVDAAIGEGPTGMTRLSIEPTDAGAPTARLDGARVPWTISLSHSGEYGVCAIAAGDVALGCDVEMTGRRGEAFVVDYFTDAERALLPAEEGEEHSRLVTLIWSAKESALKALGIGLRADTRTVSVQLLPGGSGEWQKLVVCAPDTRFDGWWRTMGECVVTIVANPPPAVPVTLQAGLKAPQAGCRLGGPAKTCPAARGDAGPASSSPASGTPTSSTPTSGSAGL